MEAQLYNATKNVTDYTVRNNFQHLLARKCWESLDSVGDDVQTDATALNRGGT